MAYMSLSLLLVRQASLTQANAHLLMRMKRLVYMQVTIMHETWVKTDAPGRPPF